MSMTKEEAIKTLTHYTSEFYTPQHREAHRMAIEALQEQVDREKPPITFADQVRRMDDNSMAWEFASLLVGGMSGVMTGSGMTPDIERLMTETYPVMLEEVKKPVEATKPATMAAEDKQHSGLIDED